MTGETLEDPMNGFKYMIPFTLEWLVCDLCGLTTGENDRIHCDEIEKVGIDMQSTMDNKSMRDETIKRSQTV